MTKQYFPPMHYALIAAGEGSRLKEEGIAAPKPLVSIQGMPMIERLIGIFMRNGARNISVICNEQMSEVQEFLRNLSQSDLLNATDETGVPYRCSLNVIVRTTASSMHSLAALEEVIPEGRFCLTTVDTIFQESEFSAFVRSFASLDETEGDGLFAVTSFVDDEKPLWVGISPQKSSCAHGAHSEELVVTGFFDSIDQMDAAENGMVSGGIYCLDTRTAFPVLRDCLSKGQSRLRNYQRALIAAGLKLRAYVFPKIMDIDHVSDIEKAEAWLGSAGGRLLAISRDRIYSPNCEAKDAAVWQETMAQLMRYGWELDVIDESAWQAMRLEGISDKYQGIFHMARHSESLALMQGVQMPVFNKAGAVQLVAKSRTKTMERLQKEGIPVPEWTACQLDQKLDASFLQRLSFPLWLKVVREDGSKPADVYFAENNAELETYLHCLETEDVIDILICKHVNGELIKCYVVLDRYARLRLFRWFRPKASGYSKFGEAEQHNLSLADFSVDETALVTLSQSIGKATGLQFFGFDAIVSKEDGLVRVIDVNDWPSYSMCQQEAAEAIASTVTEECKRTN